MYCDYFIIHVELIYDDYYHVIANYILIDRCVQLICTWMVISVQKYYYVCACDMFLICLVNGNIIIYKLINLYSFFD